MSAIAQAGVIIMPTGVDNTRGSSVWLNEDGHNVQAFFAGVITLRVSENNVNFDRDSLCVDLFTGISLNTQYDTHIWLPSQLANPNLLRVSWLVDNALLPTEIPGVPSALPESDWVRSPAQGAAIQLAVWDIVHDGGDGFENDGSPTNRVQQSSDPANPTDATILQWAEYYLQVSQGRTSNLAYIYENVYLGGSTPAQMLAGPMFLDNGPAPHTPEPGTLVLMGAGLIGIAFSIRRRNRRG